MKKKFLLYGSTLLMGLALLAAIIVFANETRPILPEKQPASAVSQQTAEITTSNRRSAGKRQQSESSRTRDATYPAEAKKKDCSCCTERMRRIKEMIRQARERKQAETKVTDRERHESQTTK